MSITKRCPVTYDSFVHLTELKYLLRSWPQLLDAVRSNKSFSSICGAFLDISSRRQIGPSNLLTSSKNKNSILTATAWMFPTPFAEHERDDDADVDYVNNIAWHRRSPPAFTSSTSELLSLPLEMKPARVLLEASRRGESGDDRKAISIITAPARGADKHQAVLSRVPTERWGIVGGKRRSSKGGRSFGTLVAVDADVGVVITLTLDLPRESAQWPRGLGCCPLRSSGSFLCRSAEIVNDQAKQHRSIPWGASI